MLNVCKLRISSYLRYLGELFAQPCGGGDAPVNGARGNPGDAFTGPDVPPPAPRGRNIDHTTTNKSITSVTENKRSVRIPSA